LLDYASGPFANFLGFTPNSSTLVIPSLHSQFQTTPETQDVIRLPGSPEDYHIQQAVLDDQYSGLYANIKTIANHDGLPVGIWIIPAGVERVTFTNPLNSSQCCFAGGSLASEMLQLASDAYGHVPLPYTQAPPFHDAEAMNFWRCQRQ